MGKKNRPTLKNYFRKGSLPSEKQFEDLIDSNLNLIEEGIDKTPEHGLELSSERDEARSLISFFSRDQPADPLWTIGFSRLHNLLFRDLRRTPQSAATEGASSDGTPLLENPDRDEGQQTTLSLGPGGRVGVNTEEPERELDVHGTIRSHGRVGVVPPRTVLQAPEDPGQPPMERVVDPSVPVPADGKWHNITVALSGCHALEVVAGVAGKESEGHYALLHAIALNTFNPKGWFFNLFGHKNRIKVHHAFYRARADRLSLRWAGDEKRYFLQIRSNRPYGPRDKKKPEEGDGVPETGARIVYHVTELWSDPYMRQSRESSED